MTIENFEAIYKVASISMFPIVLVYFFACNKLFNMLSDRHPDIHKELGNIRLIENNTIVNSFSFVKFLIFSKYKDAGDAEMNKIGLLCRGMLIIGLIVSALTIIMAMLISRY